MLVRKDWKHRVVNHGIDRRDNLECLWVEVVDNMMRVWNCVNIYAPPASSSTIDLKVLDNLPDMREDRWIVGGDWNAHDGQWDLTAKPDKRGEELLDWIDEQQLIVCNDGSVTRKERGSDRKSTPGGGGVTNAGLKLRAERGRGTRWEQRRY